ncbi:hypothetical protein IFM89_012106 [Coptis chinensis]|uniref:Uncharacterized protein n=1 Tax=Coptis chinensis TaxID=261450 RepID=A0A835I4E5_9MAGN|nr:hypothetical protein IFM89_012106 [Coptis chinensis]
MRPLEGEEWLKKEGYLVLQSLQQGPIPPSRRSDCTFIGGRRRGGGNCPLNGMNFAGHLAHAPSAFRSAMAEFGIATETRQQVLSS